MQTQGTTQRLRSRPAQPKPANHRLLIIDELGLVPLSKIGAERLFELRSQRCERALARRLASGVHPGGERRALPAQAEPHPTPAPFRTALHLRLPARARRPLSRAASSELHMGSAQLPLSAVSSTENAQPTWP